MCTKRISAQNVVLLMFKGVWAESEIFGVRSAASYAMMLTTAMRGLIRSSERSGEAVHHGNRSA
jgi:hypothetical protein